MRRRDKDKMAKPKVEKGVTLVAANTVIVGSVQFNDQLFVNGRVEGNVLADNDSGATVVISEEGTVAGEIRVPNVVINGRIEGDVYASEKVELAERAQVKGNVYYKLIEMQLGAMVDGHMVHQDRATAPGESGEVHEFKVEGGQAAD